MTKNIADREKFVDSLECVRQQRAYYANLEIGTTIWIPCSGMVNRGFPPEHIGRLDTYIGESNFKRGNWITKDEAMALGAKIATSNSNCPECKRAFMDA